MLRLILELNGEEILRADPVRTYDDLVVRHRDLFDLYFPPVAYWSPSSRHGEADRV